VGTLKFIIMNVFLNDFIYYSLYLSASLIVSHLPYLGNVDDLDRGIGLDKKKQWPSEFAKKLRRVLIFGPMLIPVICFLFNIALYALFKGTYEKHFPKAVCLLVVGLSYAFLVWRTLSKSLLIPVWQIAMAVNAALLYFLDSTGLISNIDKSYKLGYCGFIFISLFKTCITLLWQNSHKNIPENKTNLSNYKETKAAILYTGITTALILIGPLWVVLIRKYIDL
jgi:hypothetical protein